MYINIPIIKKNTMLKNLNIFTLLLTFLILISCNQYDDSFSLTGENSDDIVFYELNNNYLAPESRDFIETNFPDQDVNLSYILVGKNTYGFEADLSNDISLSLSLIHI